jgi:hypothetical protein
MSKPAHVIDFIKAGGPAKFGGAHFDDPEFLPGAETAEDENTDLAAWLRTQTWSDFAQSLADFHRDRGYLTDKQVASATSMRTKCEARQAENRIEGLSTSGLDLTELPAGFYAVPDGDTRLKVVVNRPTSGRWENFTFVHDGAEYGSRTKYGMQAPDGTYKGKIEDQLAKIVADPDAAGREYADLTANCYRCNRKLEDETSVELGIGPICRNK